MHRQILIGCLPFLGLMLPSLACAWLLLRLTRARPDWRQLVRLHHDQRGAIQSLSFVLTVPVFLMIMMFIVQLSQLTIGKVVVEYSAFAAARSAQVWIPARVSPVEMENQSSPLIYIGSTRGSDGWWYHRYWLTPTGRKFQKIKFAAVEALLPICPSRSTAATSSGAGSGMVGSFLHAMGTWSPAMAANPKLGSRMANKLAYGLSNTDIVIEVRHKENEPPLDTYLIGPYLDEFQLHEMGFKDQIIVRVFHRFALLPGPGRWLAFALPSTNSSTQDSVPDYVAARVTKVNDTYVYNLNATARLYNEGEKSVMAYNHPMLGPTTALVGSGGAFGTTSMSPEFAALLNRSASSPSNTQDNTECCDEVLPPPDQAAVELLARELPELPSVLLRRQPAQGSQP